MLTLSLASTPLHAEISYPIVGTGQSKCYDNTSEIDPPEPGQPFYGQDAQHPGLSPKYKDNGNGTVSDLNTGLVWQQSPDTNGDGVLTAEDKMTWSQALAQPAQLNAVKFGGYSDWRLPTIKELYSLIIFSGTDPSGPGSQSVQLSPFIDIGYFRFAYGDTSQGERMIDSQYASSTKYVGKSFRGSVKIFGVNFADGRIKGYDLKMPGGSSEKTFYVQCVRGNTSYGKNDFHDNGDGTISDRATGLMWTKTDSGQGMNWQAALAWVEQKNKGKYLGHDDWRLPNAKELQSIVDYTRSPDSTDSPAIDPLFDSSRITNENGQTDYPYYWTGTTHASAVAGSAAVYIAFGRTAGWPTGRPGAGPGQSQEGPDRDGPPPGGPGDRGSDDQGSDDLPPAVSYHYVDVHGAGAQRSDPKFGDPAAFPHGRGPQGDVIRIYNYIRCVRSLKNT